MQVGVVGGGINGLLTAHLLQLRGHQVFVFERHAGIPLHDYGVCLSPAAQLTCLRAGLLDLTQSFLEVGIGQTESLTVIDQVCSGSGKIASPHLLSPLFIRHHAFVDLLQAALDPDTVVGGVAVEGLRQNEQCVELDLSEGQCWQGDLLIGADGIRSTVLELLGVSRHPTFLGHRFWRGLADDASLIADGVLHRYFSGIMLRLTAFDVGSDHFGRQQTHWCLFARASTDPASVESSAGLDSVSIPDAALEELPDSIVDLIQTTEPSRIATGMVMDAEPLNRLVHARVALLGDAAHPMAPTQARGVCSGFADALVLADCLELGSADLSDALGSYQQQRLQIVRQEQRLSRQEYGFPAVAQRRGIF